MHILGTYYQGMAIQLQHNNKTTEKNYIYNSYITVGL